jgi:hypothetical protein
MKPDLKPELDLGSKATGSRVESGKQVAKKKLEGRGVDKPYQHMKQTGKMEIITRIVTILRGAVPAQREGNA